MPTRRRRPAAAVPERCRDQEHKRQCV